MPRYVLGKKSKRKHELAIQDTPPTLYVSDIRAFEKEIKPDFKYIFLDIDPIQTSIKDLIGRDPDDDIMFGGLTPGQQRAQAREMNQDYYSDLKPYEIEQIDAKIGEVTRLFYEFINQAAEPGDKLFKVTERDSGETIFVLCQPERADELQRAETMVHRKVVSKHLKSK